jgi:hypothetical protein
VGDVRFEIKKYIDEGWSLVPIHKGSKAPTDKTWTTKEYGVDAFGPDSNIGVKLGDKSHGLIDIDLDCPEAVIAAPFFLPSTPRRHGRQGTGIAHYFYYCPGAKSEFWCDVDGKKMLELRSTGGQTVIPPSIHPSGEQLFWAPFDGDTFPRPADTPTEVTLSTLRSLATSTLLGRHWPGKGTRHDAALHLAGFLAARDLDIGTICTIVKAACAIAKDDEVEDRVTAASTSVKAFVDGGKTTGGPSLADIVGKDVVDVLVKWYGGNSAIYDKVIEEMNVNRFGTRVGKDYVYGLEEEHAVVFQPARALFEEFSHQKVQVGTKTRGDAKGEPIFKTKFEIWREHPKKRTFRKVTFAPPPTVANPADYNLWKGFAVQPLFPENISSMTEEQQHQWAIDVCLPKCQLFFDLVRDVICSGNPDHYAFMVNLLALTVRYPGQPSEVAVVLKGDQGAGKGTFVRVYGRGLFGRHFVHLDRTEQLAGKFNASLSGKVVVFADEAFFAGDKSSLGSLKRLITEPTLAIERKGIDIIEEPNFMHLFMATNEDWAHQAGFKERRFFTLRVSDIHLQDHAYFNAILEQMAPGGEGLRALLSYLLTYPVNHDMVRKVPRTEELGVQQDMSLPFEQKWWKEALIEGAVGNDGQWPEHASAEEFYADYQRFCLSVKVNRPLTKSNLSRLVLSPFVTERVTRQNKKVYPLKPLAECRAIWDERAGTKSQWPEDPKDEVAVHPVDASLLPFKGRF